MTEKDEQKMSVPSVPKRTPALKRDRRVGAGPKVLSGVSIRDYLSLFFKHKRTILITFLMIIVIAALYPLLIYKAKYQARSILLVKFGWENFTPDLMPENRRMSSVNPTEVIESEVGIVKSRELKERVVSTLRPENIFPELAGKTYAGLTNTEAAMYMIERDLTVTPDKGNTIMVTFAGDSPERASAVVNQLVVAYIDRRNEIYKDPKSVLFLEKKADEFAQKLADSENRLKAFQAETSIFSFEAQRASLLQQKYDLQYNRGKAEDEIKGNMDKISELEKQMNSMPRFSQTSEAALAYRIQGTEQKILDLQLHERELAAKYKDENKFLIGARERLGIAIEFMENQRKIKPAEVLDPVWKDLRRQQFTAKTDAESANAKIKAIDQMLSDLNAEIQSFEALEQKNKTLIREATDNADKVHTYRQKLEEAKIFDELNRQKMTSVSVVERASPSNVPTNPFRPLFIFIPVVLGVAVVGSLGAAYLLELLSHGLSTPHEAERRLNLPVLVTVAVKNS